MHVPLETLVFVAYLDQLVAEASARKVKPVGALPETLNRLHAGAMREHDRPSALLARGDARWTAIPDWRLDRQVIRLGLYLRERLGVEAGQRIALLSELRPEWLIADLAALGLGAVSVAIDPRLQRGELTAALKDAAPSITFISATTQHALESLDGRAPAHGRLIALDSRAAGDGVLRLQDLLDMAGTLDTPERAQSYRAGARDIAPGRPAIRHYRLASGGDVNRIDLTHGEAIDRLRTGWPSERARPGDLAYVSDPTVSLAGRLALYAFLGDGYTTTALAPAGQELSDLAALHPTKIVAPAALLAEVVRTGDSRAGARPTGEGGWRGHVARWAPLPRARRDRRAVRQTLGGRVRWVGSTEPLDSALTKRLGTVATVGPVLR